MIQGVVNRLSQNSFLLKGWTVVLVSGLLALGAAGFERLFFYLACFPAIAFWWLDGYFLHQERLFRALYDHVRNRDEEDVDFSMDTRLASGNAGTLSKAMASRTLVVFYGVILLSVVIVTLLNL